MFDVRSMVRHAASFVFVAALAGCAVETAPGPDGQGDPPPAPSAKADGQVGTDALQECPVGGFDVMSQACTCKIVYAKCMQTCAPLPAPMKARCTTGCANRYYMCLPG